jgi:hypothetical protein
MPTERNILVKEQLIEQEFVTNNLNIKKCNTCLECHMEKDVTTKEYSYICKKCKDRNDPNHFIRNNMHPIWYEIEDDRCRTHLPSRTGSVHEIHTVNDYNVRHHNLQKQTITGVHHNTHKNA